MAEKHFYEQVNYTKEYLIPYLKNNLKDFNNHLKIIDIGCAEGGTVYELRKQGYNCDGIELEPVRVETAKKHNDNAAKISVGDITEELKTDEKYDIVILRDVIEHIPDKAKALSNIAKLLNPKGVLFMAFPLKFSPYAGHNQNATNWVKYFWYVTLLPKSLIKLLVPPENVNTLTELKETAISYHILKKLLKNNWKFIRKDFFISRPIYKIRFGWRIIKFPNIPVLRELVNGCEVLIEKNIKP